VKILLVVVLAWLVCGCSTLRFAYENADTYVRWKAESYVTLEGEDADELDDKIDEFHTWHRRNELPKYAGLARDALKRFDAGLSRPDLVWGYDSLVAQAKESLHEAAVRVAPMLDRMTPEQLAQLEKRFAEDNRKFSRENRGSEKDRRNRRAKRTVQRLEEWVGKLSKAQVERVRQFSERVPLYEELRERDHRRIQGDLLVMFRAREAQKRLPAYADHWDRGREPALVAANRIWRTEFDKMLLDLDRTLSAEQRTRAVTRLRGFSEDFAALATGTATPPK